MKAGVLLFLPVHCCGAAALTALQIGPQHQTGLLELSSRQYTVSMAAQGNNNGPYA